MLPQSLPNYSVGPFFGFVINTTMTLLCFVNIFLFNKYRPLRSLLSFYLFSALFFLGWVIYGLQKSPESILLGYRIDLASLALLPATWAWFESSLSNKGIDKISWVIIIISFILSALALFGRGPYFLGFPLEPHNIDPWILRPKSKIIRTLIHFYCLIACLYYFGVSIMEIKKRGRQRPLYLFPFAIGMFMWFIGGLHDALRSSGFFVPIKGQILWFTSLWLSVFLTLTVALHFRSIDKALREAKDVFQKFVPPAYLKRIASKGLGAIKLGEADRQLLTILCCDIRGFTALSEKLNPSELICFINYIYEKITKVVDHWDGVIDKFLGDGFISIFEGKNSAENAIKCGIQILSAVKEINREKLNSHLKIGIGLHMGEVILGTIGSRERMDSTIIGSTVNLVKRLEEATKLLGVDFIISDKIAQDIKKNIYHIRRLGELYVKGLREPIAIHEVYDNDPFEIKNLKDRVSPLITEGIEYYKKGDFGKALSKLAEARNLFPHDRAIELLIDSINKTLEKDEDNRTKIVIGLHIPIQNNP